MKGIPKPTIYKKPYDRRKTYENYDASIKEYDAIWIGGGPAGRFGSSFMKAMGGKQLTIYTDDHLGGKCPKEGAAVTMLYYDNAVELDFHRQFQGICWWPEFNEKVEILPIIRLVDEGLENVQDFMFHQSKEEIGLEFILNEEAKIIDPHTVEVNSKQFKAKNIVIGTGSRPHMPDMQGIDYYGVYNYHTFRSLDYEPEKVAVIGASRTGSLYASFFRACGCETHLFDKLPFYTYLDKEIREYVVQNMMQRGLNLHEEAEVVAISGSRGKVNTVTYKTKEGKEESIGADFVFVATGAVPNSEIAEPLGVKIGPDNEIVVNSRMQTSVPGVYAIGDLIGKPHEMWKARKSGMVAAQNILGQDKELKVDFYPQQMHTTYEIVWVGDTEEEARKKGHNKLFIVRIPNRNYDKPPYPPDAPMPLRPQSLPIAERSTLFAYMIPPLSGYQKIIYDGDTRRILGAHHVGYGAKDAFQYLAYLIEKGFTIDELVNLNELFLNPDHYIQLSRLRAGMKDLVDLG